MALNTFVITICSNGSNHNHDHKLLSFKVARKFRCRLQNFVVVKHGITQIREALSYLLVKPRHSFVRLVIIQARYRHKQHAIT